VDPFCFEQRPWRGSHGCPFLEVPSSDLGGANARPHPAQRTSVAGPDLGRSVSVYSPTAMSTNGCGPCQSVWKRRRLGGRVHAATAGSLPGSQTKRGEKSPSARGVNGLFGGSSAE
jgi:hypothetical protein